MENKTNFKLFENYFDKFIKNQQGKCLHDQCPECGGSGIKKKDKTPCVHFISCPCSKCNPFTF